MSVTEMRESKPENTRALVLGGGGPVGRAWESGLVAGLLDLGINLDAADLIVGTSAGAIVGAELAVGASLDQAGPTIDPASGGTMDPAGMQQILGAQSRAGTSRQPDKERQSVGAFSLAASTISEQASLARDTFSPIAGRDWPGNFWATAVSTRTGRRQVWHAASRIPLEYAAASSSAMPGVWPPISIGADRYMDGGIHSSLNADLATGYNRVLVVSCFSLDVVGDPDSPPAVANRMLGDELQLLRDGGTSVDVIIPDGAFLELTANGMRMLDNSLVPEAYRFGKRQASVDAHRIKDFWSTAI